MRYDHQFREKGYHSALMTTFSFDPICFENVVLTTLKSAQCRNIAVLGDSRMINQASMDLGPPGFAGQNYHLAKRALKSCFHPKIVAQFGKEKGRLLVGSSNLTTSGINGNLEAFSLIIRDEENIDTAGLFKKVLDYIWRHTAQGDIGMKRAIDQVFLMTPWLKDVDAVSVIEAASGSRLGVFTDSEDASIADQLLSEVGSDEVSELIVVSPFWDEDLRGLRELRDALGNPETRIIPELAEQDFAQEVVRHDPKLSVMSPEPLTSDERRVHSKVIICKSRDADYVLTGSMNSSQAGLWGRGEFGGNAEAAIFRKIVDRNSVQTISDELALALATPFPANQFRTRTKKGAEGGETLDVVRDGGLVQIKNGLASWLPPQRYEDALNITLHDDTENVIGEISPKPKEPQPVSDDLAGKVRFGRVGFADGTMSAPFVVTVFSQLERAAEPPQSLRVRRLVDELKAKRDIRDIFEMIGRLDALQHKEMQSKRQKLGSGGGQRKNRGKTQDGITLDESDFYQFDDEENVENELVTATTLSELRRAINRVVGHGEAHWADPNDALDLHDQNLSSVEEAESQKGNADASTDGSDPSDDGPAKEPARRIIDKRKTGSRAEARQFIDDLRIRSNDLQKLVGLQKPGEVQLDQALLFQVIVYATLAVASPDEPCETYPLPAFERTGENCWIRILARFLVPHCRSWQSDALLGSELEGYQLEALATLSVACQVLIAYFDRLDAIPFEISKPFRSTAGSFLKSVSQMCETNSLVADRFSVLNERIFNTEDVQRLMVVSERALLTRGDQGYSRN